MNPPYDNGNFSPFGSSREDGCLVFAFAGFMVAIGVPLLFYAFCWCVGAFFRFLEWLF